MNASTSIATRREQLSVLWRQTPTASIAGVSIAGFMCLFLATRVDRDRLGLWFGGVVLVAALRWQLALFASRHVHRTERPVPWLVAFTIAAFCTGAVWGWASAVDVGAHAGISCATLASGAVRCWGRGEVGRLGTSDHLPRTTPTAVTGLTNAVQVAVADAACARLTTGSVVCWGPRAGLGNEARAVAPRGPVSVVFP
jgi:hypothetical protein